MIQLNQDSLYFLKLYETIKRNAGCTPKSIAAIVWSDLRIFAEYLGDKPFQSVTMQDIEEFFTHCFTVRKNGAETASRKQSSLNTFYNTMIKKEYFDIKNPLNKIDKIKFDPKPREHLSKAEFKSLIKYLQDTNDKRGIAYVLLSYTSGCRISEIIGLDRDSLDYDRLRFKVLGKGQRFRYCIFSKEAGQTVQDYLSTRQDSNVALILSRENNRWSKEAIERFIKQSIKNIGVTKRITPHCLRHSRAMHLLEDGVPLNEIQKILGHKSISTTQVYAVLSLDQAQKSVNELDQVNQWLS